MTQIAYVPGQMQEFVSNIEFSLNLENSRVPVKVRIGEIVYYDGTTARYTKPTGEEVIGKTHSLRSAITNNWLTLKGIQIIFPTGVKTDKMREDTRDPIQYKQPDYNPLTGGGFNEFMNKEAAAGNIAVAGNVTPSNVIREEDLIVRHTGSQAAPQEAKSRSKLEVTGDQVVVKESGATTVSSSTAIPSQRKAHKTSVIKSEDYGAERTISFKNKTAKQQPTQAKKTFTVDTTTPRVAEDASLAEIKRATETIPDERQDGQVVKKIGQKKMVIQQDGESDARVVKRIGEIRVKPDATEETTEIEGITFKKPAPSVEKPPIVTVRGSEPIADLSGVKTQAEVDAIEKKYDKSFLDKLPKEWSEMHWVQKEKFILEQTDKEFVKFILTVEPTKAVQNACRKRLLELEKLALAAAKIG
jgi:hypothetical protein